MAPPHTTRAPPADDLDDLFNFTSNNNTTSTSQPANAPNRRRLNGDDPLATGLGIDEEIKIRKPRAPIAKLDEDRLLSQNGIPKLRHITKSRLKFKGKGHEFSDVSRLLNTYQVWLDELFPKANFADGVAIIEKLGHKKRLQVMRRAWIEEDRPKIIDLEQEDLEMHDKEGTGPQTEAELAEARARAEEERAAAGKEGERDQAGVRSSSPIIMDLDDDEGLYDEPAAHAKDSERRPHEEEHEPDEDELDALMAEDAARSQAPPPRPVTHNNPAEDEDEDMDALDALLAEDATKAPSASIPIAKVVVEEDDFGDDEEAMAAMAGW